MPFIGNQPALSYTSFAKQDFTTSATTSYTLDNPVANANELALFINFVRQEPTTAYSASGTTLTLTSATSATDDMYCVFLGKAVQTVNPPNASVGTSQLVDGAVTKAKTSDLMYPAFEAYRTSTQTLTNDAWVKVTFDTETYDTDSAFASDKFTIPSNQAGKYYIYSSVILYSTVTNDIADAYLGLYKNGTLLRNTQFSTLTVFDINVVTLSYATVLDAAVADYYEMYAYVDTSSGTPRAAEYSNFGAYRIGA